jgi:type II secretory pathway pseudopilin PulG/TM2 domain-containing membrane protein YozV
MIMSDVVNSEKKFCSECGKELNPKAEICPGCGVRVMIAKVNGTSKISLLLITFFLGGIGGHKYYQRKYALGVLYLLFCWTGIPAIIAFIEFIVYCFKSEEDLQQNYPETSGSAIAIAIVMSFVVIAFIGILAAIAIPQFSAYRTKAYNSAARSDLKTCISQAEAYFADYGKYPIQESQFSCNNTDMVSIYYLAMGDDQFQIISYHNSGNEAYIRSSDDLEIFLNTKDEIVSQLNNKFGQNTAKTNFNFIEF